MGKIITTINAIEKEQICNMFADWIEESMTCVMDSYESLEWYESCDFDDYFTELQEIYTDQDELVGEGLDFISFKVVVNEETKPILEELFESAREKVYDIKMEQFADALLYEEVCEYLCPKNKFRQWQEERK